MNKEEQRQRIGQRIADLRKQKGMTQQDLADITGNQRNHISRIESGKYSVGFDTLQAIAEALGMTVDIIDPRLTDLAPLKRLTPKPVPTSKEETIEEYIDEEEHRVPILEYKKNELEKIMSDCNGNRKKAAAIIGVSERTLYRRMKQFGII